MSYEFSEQDVRLLREMASWWRRQGSRVRTEPDLERQDHLAPEVHVVSASAPDGLAEVQRLDEDGTLRTLDGVTITPNDISLGTGCTASGTLTVRDKHGAWWVLPGQTFKAKIISRTAANCTTDSDGTGTADVPSTYWLYSLRRVILQRGDDCCPTWVNDPNYPTVVMAIHRNGWKVSAGDGTIVDVERLWLESTEACYAAEPGTGSRPVSTCTYVFDGGVRDEVTIVDIVCLNGVAYKLTQGPTGPIYIELPGICCDCPTEDCDDSGCSPPDFLCFQWTGALGVVTETLPYAGYTLYDTHVYTNADTVNILGGGVRIDVLVSYCNSSVSVSMTNNVRSSTPAVFGFTISETGTGNPCDQTIAATGTVDFVGDLLPIVISEGACPGDQTGTGGGISTECCPSVAESLLATFTAKTGYLTALPDSVTIEYAGGAPSTAIWDGLMATPPCMPRLQVWCDEGVWYAWITGCAGLCVLTGTFGSPEVSSSSSCDPLEIVFNLTSYVDCDNNPTTGSVTVTITDP